MTGTIEADIVDQLRKTANYLVKEDVDKGAVSAIMLCEAAEEIEDLRIAVAGVNRDWNKAIAERDAAVRRINDLLVEISSATHRNTLLQGFKHTDADKTELNTRLNDIRAIIDAYLRGQQKDR